VILSRECTDWSSCIDGEQTRVCKPTLYCQKPTYVPITTRKCGEGQGIILNPEKEPEVENPVTNTTSKEGLKVLDLIIPSSHQKDKMPWLMIISVILIIGILGLILKPKTAVFDTNSLLLAMSSKISIKRLARNKFGKGTRIAVTSHTMKELRKMAKDKHKGRLATKAIQMIQDKKIPIKGSSNQSKIMTYKKLGRSFKTNIVANDKNLLDKMHKLNLNVNHIKPSEGGRHIISTLNSHNTTKTGKKLIMQKQKAKIRKPVKSNKK